MKALILAGGSGTRLWPASRAGYPKQFLKFHSNESLLQKTVRRHLKIFDGSEIFVLTAQPYFHIVKDQLQQMNPALTEHILVEEMQKNTAPAIAYALKKMIEEFHIQEEDVVLVSPSDHDVGNETVFTESVKTGQILAKLGFIITFGIKPSYPETGYGYIQAGSPLSPDGFCVERFVEKPNLETAQKYIESGNFYWNSGMFLFQIQTLLEEFYFFCPEISRYLKNLETDFHKLPEISLDYAIMEKTKKAALVPLPIFWSDVGSWEHVYQKFPKDERQNVKLGHVVDVDSRNSLIIGDKRLVATFGLENMLVVETADAVLVTKKDHSQKVKEIVLQLKKQGRKEIQEHVTTYRPWGNFTVLDEGNRYKIKKIQIQPSQMLSLQLHHHRSEHWVVIQGTALVTIGEKETFVHENESIYVPKGAVHRVHNPGKVLLEIIETQVGEYLGEDDIVRLEDIYGRQHACV